MSKYDVTFTIDGHEIPVRPMKEFESWGRRKRPGRFDRFRRYVRSLDVVERVWWPMPNRSLATALQSSLTGLDRLEPLHEGYRLRTTTRKNGAEGVDVGVYFERV